MFHYFILGILFSRLFISEPIKEYEYLCDKTKLKVLTSTTPICFDYCPKGYINLRIQGYENNSIYYHIDKKNLTVDEVISYYHNLLKQDTIYINIYDAIMPLEDRPAFGYFSLNNNGSETNLFVPFTTNPRYDEIKELITKRKMLDLYYPTCVYYHNTRINLTFKKHRNHFRASYTISYDDIYNIYNISTLYATLANRVEKNVTKSWYII